MTAMGREPLEHEGGGRAVSGEDGAVPYAEALARVAAQDDDLDGIPVFLALDDAPPVAAAPAPPPDRLGRLALGYLQEGRDGRAETTLDDVALAFRILGACHFDEPGGDA